MTSNWLLLCVVVVVLFVIQFLGVKYQVNSYRKAVRRVHQMGNVGIGQKKGGFSFGHLVLVVCDSEGVIRRVEVMKGITFLARFREQEELLGMKLVGSNISDFLGKFDAMENKQKKKYKGYYQAMQALDERLHPQAAEESDSLENCAASA